MNKINQLCRLRKAKMKRKVKYITFTTNDELTKKFREWYVNGGRDELDESMERANEAIEYYRKAREPDWSRIHEPMTI